jgi:NAD+ diphosphatase
MLQTPAHFEAAADRTAINIDSSLPPLRLLFRNNELCVTDDGTRVTESEAHEDDLVIGAIRDQLVLASCAEAGASAPSGHRFAGLRSLFGVLPDHLVAVAGRAFQVVDWNRTHRFCGVCATPTDRAQNERARRCPACSHTVYPRISPAMMCLVTRGDQILLARNVNFPAGRYSALAGFLEAGESIEDAVHREVREEVGIEVGQPKYFASQSWPFPNSLMIAYTAEYASGELTPNGHEIAEADWFDHTKLPQLPPRISIARALIDDTLQRLRNTQP